MRRFQEVEIGEALKRLKGGKAMGPDGIPIEVWRVLNHPNHGDEQEMN